jgi:Alpha/beta hydrolase of unknown function (DUF900)
MPRPPWHHVVNVGPDGTFGRSGSAQTSPRDVDRIMQRVGDHQPAKVAVHFHGGLVSERRGLELAARILPTYTAGGAYGVIVVWETGLLETVVRRLDTVNQTKLFNKLVNYAIRHAAKWLGASVGARGPGEPMSWAEVDAARRSDAEMERMDVRARGKAELIDLADVDAAQPELELELQADLEADAELTALLDEEAEREPVDPQLLAEVQADGARGLVSTIAVARILVRIVSRTLRRFTAGRDHGVIPTAVEEVLREAYLADLAGWVWSGMKGAAADMFSPNDGPITEDAHAGSYLLAGLAALQDERPELTIDLIGHSAGSIAVAHFLEAAAERHPGFRVRNLVLLAPAVSAEVFDEGIAGHEDRFDAFRMFTMRDELERRDHLVPGVYPRSLLYFISGVLDGTADAPVVGLHRHTTGEPPYDAPPLDAVHRFLGDGDDRVVLSRTEDTAGAGLRSRASRHGDFDDDERTLASLTAIVAG